MVITEGFGPSNPGSNPSRSLKLNNNNNIMMFFRLGAYLRFIEEGDFTYYVFHPKSTGLTSLLHLEKYSSILK